MSDNPNILVSLATATPGGGFPAYGTAFAAGLRSARPEPGDRAAAAIRGGHDNMARLLPQASETTLENTAAAVADPGLIHPGMRRFLRDAGLLPG